MENAPKTVDEAMSRKERLGKECEQLQWELGKLPRHVSAVAERRRLAEIRTAKVKEIGELREWIRQERTSMERAMLSDGESRTKLIATAKTSFVALVQLVDAQRLRIEELTLENQSLWRRIQEMQPVGTNDPSLNGKREEWRMAENYDKEAAR